MNTSFRYQQALVLGGGGSTGNAWLIGVLAGLAEAGLAVTSTDLTVGTSAGSTAAFQVPQIDTVPFLRPTEPVTVFLQQLGRGLRPLPDKSVLTALDFVGHQRKEFRFDQRFAALTGLSRRQLERHVTEGFPFLPSGCQIVLDPVAREVVLASVREQVAPRWAALRDELRRFPGDRLAAFLEDTGRDLADVLRGRGRSWTAPCRAAGKSLPPAGPSETFLLSRAAVA
jgi:hypothetical protein